MQISLFRQFFLTQFDAFSVSANGLADYFFMSQGLGHASLGKQEAGGKNIVNSPLFFTCIPFGSALESSNNPGESEFVKTAKIIKFKKKERPYFLWLGLTIRVLLLMLLIQITSTSYGQQFEAEGTIIYSAEGNGANYQETKHFIITRDGVEWKIRTIPINRGKSQESPTLFEEAGSDGINIFYLVQYDTNKEYLFGSPDLTKQKNFAPASGRVQKASCPPCLEMNLIYPVWLAYCSSPYLSALNNNKVVAPLFVPEDFFSGPIPKRFDLPAKWKLNSSSFVSEISWFSEGKYAVSEKDGTQKLEKYPPPFDGGFLQASFETTDWTNFSGILLPGSFLLKVFAPNYKIEGKTNLDLFYTIAANVETIRSLSNFSYIPKLTTRTLITDSRVFLGERPVSYGSVSNWDTEDEIKTKLHNVELGLGPSPSKTYHYRKSIVLMVMVSITAIFIAAVTMTRLMNKKDRQNMNKN
jgi:hypothetical protein